MISLKNVSKKYGRDFVALDNISLNLPNKGFISLCGENGCGKTTLLNLISTIDKPTSGQIIYNDILYCRRYYKYLRNSVISYIQQENVFVDYLTIIENINISNPDENSLVCALDDFHLLEKGVQKPYQLSGGQRQKSSFIRGIMKNCSVLLVDEPTSNMDKQTELITFQLLKEISKNKLVVIVSHNKQLIEDYSDIVVHMECGKIASIIDNTGTPEIIFKENTILVPEERSVDHLSDWVRIRSLLSEQKEVFLKLCKSAKNKEHNLDYSVSISSNDKAQSLPSKMLPQMASRSTFHTSPKLFITAIFVALLITIMAIVVCLNGININKFEYDMFISNGYRQINLCPNENVYVLYDKSQKEFTMEEYKAFLSKYKVNSTILTDFENATLGFEYDEIYSPVLYGFSVINENTDLNLIVGEYPSEQKIAITDYIADALLNHSFYSCYEEIINNGFIVNGYQFEVAGIIDTDYEEYVKAMSSIDFKNSQVYVDWCLMREKVYSRFYVNEKTYQCDSTSAIYMLPINNGEFFCNAHLITKENDIVGDELNQVYINEKMAKVINKSSSFKTANGFYIVKDVIEDGHNKPIIYLNNNQLEILCENPYVFSSFNLYLESFDDYDYVKGYNLQHNTPISSIVNKSIDIILILKTYFGSIILVVLILTLIFSVTSWLEWRAKDSFALYCLIMNGFSSCQICVFEMAKYVFKITLELLLSSIMFFMASNGVNSILSRTVGCSFLLIPNDIGSLGVSFGLYSLIMFVVILLDLICAVFKKPIHLYFVAKKR